MTPDEQAIMQAFEDELYKKYKKTFGEVFASCMYSLPPNFELRAAAYKINKPLLIIRACREVLETYEEALYNLPDPQQTEMFEE